jgi:hypothetical protein
LPMNPVPRMAKTFDNISESSATNYLFLFAQRTLALQNEPPTPPPLNALGLPCKAMSLLWACTCWLKEKTVVNEKPAGEVKQAGSHRWRRVRRWKQGRWQRQRRRGRRRRKQWRYGRITRRRC